MRSFDFFQRSFNYFFQISGGEFLQNKNTRARNQSGVDFEAGIFGRCPNKGNRAIFDIGQKGILLCFVPAMDFVDEKNRFFVLEFILLGFRNNF